jgi:hypothetical protein
MIECEPPVTPSKSSPAPPEMMPSTAAPVIVSSPAPPSMVGVADARSVVIRSAPSPPDTTTPSLFATVIVSSPSAPYRVVPSPPVTASRSVPLPPSRTAASRTAWSAGRSGTPVNVMVSSPVPPSRSGAAAPAALASVVPGGATAVVPTSTSSPSAPYRVWPPPAVRWSPHWVPTRPSNQPVRVSVLFGSTPPPGLTNCVPCWVRSMVAPNGTAVGSLRSIVSVPPVSVRVASLKCGL